MTKYGRLDAFSRGQIVAYDHAGWSATQIAKTRGAFLVRLRRTVRWMNANLQVDLLSMCMDQHVRAREVLELRGAKTSF